MKIQIIIDPYYDEIGSFRNRFIGIYDGIISKIVHPDYGDKTEELEYHYRSTVKAKYVNENDKKWLFEINGENNNAKGFVSRRSLNELQKGKSYNLSILSIVYSSENPHLILGVISEKLLNRPYDHTDKSDDFKMNETYEGTIVKRNKNKYYVALDSGKKTYFTRSSLEANQVINVKHGDKVELTKKRFDVDIEKTIWEVRRVPHPIK